MAGRRCVRASTSDGVRTVRIAGGIHAPPGGSMTRKDALELLGLSADATAEEIGRQYAHHFSDYQIRLTNAPTPALKRLYQKNLAELEEAYALLAATPEEVVIG